MLDDSSGNTKTYLLILFGFMSEPTRLPLSIIFFTILTLCILLGFILNFTLKPHRPLRNLLLLHSVFHNLRLLTHTS